MGIVNSWQLNTMKFLGLLTALSVLMAVTASPFFADPISTATFTAAGGLVLTGASGATLATIPTASLLLGKALLLKKAVALKALANSRRSSSGRPEDDRRLLASAFRATAFLRRRALPRRREAVGMVARVAPDAPVNTRPPAAVKVAVEMGSAKKGEAVTAISTDRAVNRPRNFIVFSCQELTIPM